MQQMPSQAQRDNSLNAARTLYAKQTKRYAQVQLDSSVENQENNVNILNISDDTR